MAGPIEVVIRNSTGPPGDESYMMLPDDTILQLKSQIETRHPSHPLVENQRLIFCGQVLANEKRIREVHSGQDEGSKITILLFFRSNPAPQSPPPQAHQQQIPQYPPMNGMPMLQNQALFGHGMPMVNPMMGPGHFGMGFNAGMGYMQPRMGQQGQPGYPGMMGQQRGQFGWQGGNPMAPGGAPAAQAARPDMPRVPLNIPALIAAALVSLLVLAQGGENSYFWSALIMTLAFIYFRPGFGGRRQQQQQQQAQGQNGAAAGANANGNENRNQNNEANENAAAARNEAGGWMPALLRYDWRIHTGVVGEVLGFVCPFVFSLWPSWDPSIMGDHPDVVRRRQQEAAQQEAQAREEAPAPPPNEVPVAPL